MRPEASPRRVIVVGSLNRDTVVRIDRLPRIGETAGATAHFTASGGKGGNQAVAAARLRAVTELIGAVGDDAAAREELSELSAEGVGTTHLKRSPGDPTGIAVVFSFPNGDNAIVHSPGANHALGEDHVLRALDLLDVRERDIVLVSCEIDEEAIAAACGRAHAVGALLLLNPAPVPTRNLDALLTRTAPLLVPNEVELAQLCEALSISVSPASLGSATGSPVVVTRGSRGVTITNDQETRLVEPLRGIDVVDTTGAGDTLCGALAAELARGFPLYDAVRHAVSAATLSVSGSGARGAMPSYDQLLPYLSR